MSKPSRADLLKEGGIYPVVVPLGWNLVGPAGEDEAIPHIPGHPVHRILAKGALMAVEPEPASQPEMMMVVRRYTLSGPITSDILDRYADSVFRALQKQGLEPHLNEKRVGICALSPKQSGRVVLRRDAAGDGRMEIRFLVRDQKGDAWELTYLIRQVDADRWRSLLAEVDGTLLA